MADSFLLINGTDFLLINGSGDKLIISRDIVSPKRIAIDSIIHSRTVSSEILSRVVDSVMRR